MKNINLIYSKNTKRMKIKSGDFNIRDKAFTFEVNTEIFNGKVISVLMEFVQGVRQKNNMGKAPIRFLFPKAFTFADKLTYIIFECICFSLISE